jgi:cytochrome P450
MVLLTLGAILLTTIVYLWYKLRPTRLSSKLPSPKGIPLFGNALQLNPKEAPKQLERWAMEYGTLYKLNLLGKETLVMSDIHEIGNLLKKRPEEFSRFQSLSKVINDFGLAGLFTLEGAEWKESRNIIAPSLAPARVNEMKACIWGHAIQLRNEFAKIAELQDAQLSDWFPFQTEADAAKQIQKSGEGAKIMSKFDPRKRHDVLLPLQQSILAIVLETSFSWGESDLLGTDMLDKLKDMFTVVSDRFYAPLPLWKIWKSPRDIRAQQAADELTTVIQKVIDKHDKQQSSTVQKKETEEEIGAHLKRTVLANILQTRGKLNDSRIIGDISQVMLAGYGKCAILCL